MNRIKSLEFRKITKSFQGFYANRDVSMSIQSGEILGLLGENGAGKTTLMNILFGLYKADSGTILINGNEVVIQNPKDAIRAGIGMVHQHFMLVEAHTVVENLALGYEGAPFFDPHNVVREKILQAGKDFGLEVDPDAPIWQLSAGEQQRVEILRALIQGADLLILDEPTSVLTPQEAMTLFEVLRKMREKGHSVILITHKMDEIIEICDRVTVLRKGELAGEADPKTMTKTELARWMVGRELKLKLDKAPFNPGENVLEVEGITVLSDRGQEAVKNLTLRVRKKEILGLAGVSGNGQRELVEAVTGLRHPIKGKIHLKGEDITHLDARVKSNLGVAHIPEERIRFGIVPGLLIGENAVLKKHHNPPFSRVMFLDYHKIQKHAMELVENFQVSAPNPKSPVKNLSGGNIQKLILGREITSGSDLLVASHPTYGLDVGATEYIREQLIAFRDQGGAVLLISEDLEELMAVSDELLVISDGTIMGRYHEGRTSVEDIGLMMAGTKQENLNV